MIKRENLWVVIPAAGVGKRMQVDHPKQYLTLAGKTVLERSIACFSSIKEVKGIVLVLSKDDAYWPELNIQSPIPLHLAEGGEERYHSVLNGLTFLHDKANINDWVMVHDAARPFLHETDIHLLIKKLWSHPVGGLLGLPVSDTLKLCATDQSVRRTVSRLGLWRALTPQMFRYQKLFNALREVGEYPENVTDESSAMEMAGHEPVLVEGRWDNIKITHPQDLIQANLILDSLEE